MAALDQLGLNLDPVGQAIRAAAPRPGEIDYQHTVLTNVYLPVRDPKEVREWDHRVGNDAIRVEAGSIWNERHNQYEKIGLPFGPRARLILIHLTTEAKRTKCPRVEVGRSLRQFCTTLGLSTGGSVTGPFRDQLRRLAVATIRVARSGDGVRAPMQVNASLMSGVSMWSAPEGEHRDWEETVVLGEEFYRSIIRHAVPLDDRAIRRLKNNATALDMYAWLAGRLCRVEDSRGDHVTWKALHAQFGQGTRDLWKFRQSFEATRKLVAEVYDPAGHIQQVDDGLLLPFGPPPVPPKL